MLDTKQVDGLRDVFTPEATALLRGVECNGVDEIMARIGGAILRLDATQHLISNHQVAVDGDTATHRCQLHSQHVRAGVVGGTTSSWAGTTRTAWCALPADGGSPIG